MTLNEPVKAKQLDKQVKSVWQVRVAGSGGRFGWQVRVAGSGGGLGLRATTVGGCTSV